jgi:hypothetical protein
MHYELNDQLISHEYIFHRFVQLTFVMPDNLLEILDEYLNDVEWIFLIKILYFQFCDVNHLPRNRIFRIL